MLTICAVVWFISLLSMFYLIPRFGYISYKYMLYGGKYLQLKETYELDMIVTTQVLLLTSVATLDITLILCDIAILFITLTFLADNHYQDWALQLKGFPLNLYESEE